MKQVKVLFVLVVCALLGIQLVDAKEDMYGNIRMRSIGVGANPNLPKQHVLLINSSGDVRHYQRSIVGSPKDVVSMNGAVAIYNFGDLKEKQITDNMFVSKEPIVSQAIVYYSFGGGEDPNHPGTPIGDAVPFVLLMALGYIYVRCKV